MLNLYQVTFDVQQKAQQYNLPGSDKDPNTGFGHLVGGLLSAAMTIGALALFLYLIWGGFDWITSEGDKGKMEKARNKMTQAVIGMVILSASTAVFMIVQRFLGICVLRLGGSC